jgi:hypothetical protein
MRKSKKLPLELLKVLERLNPGATPAQLKGILSDEMQKDPEYFSRRMFDDLFAQFEQETGFRGGREDALQQFEAWLNKPSN